MDDNMISFFVISVSIMIPRWASYSGVLPLAVEEQGTMLTAF